VTRQGPIDERPSRPRGRPQKTVAHCPRQSPVLMEIFVLAGLGVGRGLMQTGTRTLHRPQTGERAIFPDPVLGGPNNIFPVSAGKLLRCKKSVRAKAFVCVCGRDAKHIRARDYFVVQLRMLYPSCRRGFPDARHVPPGQPLKKRPPSCTGVD